MVFFVIILVPNLVLFIYFIKLIRIEALIYVYPISKFLFSMISCCLVKRKDFQETYFPDPDIVRKEKKRLEEKERNERQASSNTNQNGAKPLKS